MSAPAPVVLLTSSYPSPAQPYRGAFVRAIARRLAAEAPVEVLAPRLTAAPPLESEGQLTVRRYPIAGASGSLKSLPGLPLVPVATLSVSGLAAALRARRRLGPRAVFYAHWAAPSGFIAALAARRRRRPLVVHCHGSDIHTAPERGAAVAASIRYAVRSADQLIAVSRPIQRALRRRYGVPDGRVHLIPCGVDTARFHPGDRELARRGLGLPSAGIRLLYVGDLIPEKGVLLLLEAGAELLRAGADLHITLVGSGPLGDTLRDRAALLGIAERFVLLGPQPNERIPELLRASDALVLPSASEGSPVSIIEARAVGLPVLATRVGGVPDLVADGRDGFLFPPGDARALAGALRRFLSLDAGDRAALGRAALARRGRFDIDAQAAQVRALIEAARLSPRRRARGWRG